MFAQRIAYDSAVMLGSGGTGQTPLFTWKNLGKSANDAFNDAAGSFIDTLATDNGYLSLDVCRPPGFSANLIITTALFAEIQPTKPRCNLRQIQTAWDKYLKDPKAAQKAFGYAIDPRQNELGVTLSLRQSLLKKADDQKAIQKTLDTMSGGLRPITEKITGFIKTPVSRVENQAATAQEIAAQDFNTYTGDIVADALGVFTNTLASRLMKRLLEGDVKNPGGTFSGGSGWGSIGGVEYAMQINSSISTPDLKSVDKIDIISEFSNCPSPQKFAQLNNCTINSGFEQALRSAEAGKALTVAEAIQAKLINGNWTFATNHPEQESQPSKWYESDLRKLRRARIIPIGWELAAKQFAGSDTTLKQVMDGFSDSASQFYHLIDPNWVLRAPPSQCRIQASGQQLVSEGSNRQDTCVDTQNCVAEDANGKCQAWGYCTREKNIWRFNGDSCESPAGSGYSPYATCQAFTSRNGDTNLYLQNSLVGEGDDCTSDSIGCRWYSMSYNPGASSPINLYNADERIYLKDFGVAACEASAEGCTQFLRLSNFNTTALASTTCGTSDAACLTQEVISRVTPAVSTDSYEQYAKVQPVTLREAPSFLNCYDADTANDSPLCKNYLNSCKVDDVGCELYTPADGSPAVPAIKGNTCPNECVGYNNYQQNSSFFDQTTTNLNFIPRTAKTCPAQAVGCEEFTNIQTNETKEYYAELRQCIKPDQKDINNNSLDHTYYTWVGSNLTGYQLRTWQLKASNPTVPNSPPATTDNSDIGSKCGDGATPPTDFPSNPDCKQFYDATGGIHYRYWSKTITASDACTKYRATSISEDNCAASGGIWDINATPPACFYSAIPQEGRICSAQYVGCREYRGPTADNVRLVFPITTFGDNETGSSIDTSPTGGFTPGSNSNESTSAFGHSFAGSGTITKDITGKITKGKLYFLNFWIKSSAATSTVSASINTNPVTNLGSVQINGDWQVYTLGSVQLTADVPTNLTLEISSPAPFYIDNVALREIGDTFFVRKDTWVTPSTCTGNDLRCSAYTDRAGTRATLTDFSKVCRVEAVGCEALVNTQNSSSPKAFAITLPDQPALNISADQVIYRVYDTKKACDSAAKACQRVGKPNLNSSGNVQDWSDKFVKLNPDTLSDSGPNSLLCSRAQDKCEQFVDAGSPPSQHFFKDPGNGVCVYKQDSVRGDNWYKKDTNELCNLLENPSFEKVNDTGSDLITNGDFENITTWPTNWQQGLGDNWQLSIPSDIIHESYSGTQSAKNIFAGGAATARQGFDVTVGQTYTARVWVKADTGIRRTLNVSGCGVNVSDYTEQAGVWEKLQVSFKPTIRTCSLELRTSVGGSAAAGIAYYDNATVNLTDVFPGWRINGPSGEETQSAILTKHESVAGKYWGSNVLEVESGAKIWAGIWSNDVKIEPSSAPRYFTVSAYVYIPDIPQNLNFTSWQLTHHAIPTICDWRLSNGQWTCHHYSIEPGSDETITGAVKGKWLYKHALLKVDPNVTTVSVGLITNGGVEEPAGSGNMVCTPETCSANQVIYIDQISLTESQVPLAYSCPADQVSCKAFHDPELTKQTYYYLDNTKLDKKCTGVSQKEGCLLFTDLSSSQLTSNAAVTYAASKGQNDKLIPPQSASPNNTNTILKVSRDRVCGEWLACQSEGTGFVGGKASSICYALGKCDSWGTSGSGVSKCGRWLNPPASPQPLTITNYQSRATDWNGMDYSGYSIPNKYSIELLTQKNYSTNPLSTDIRLTYLDTRFKKCGGTGDSCQSLAIGSSASPCSAAATCQYEDKGTNGAGPLDEKKLLSDSNTSVKACRAYPEKDSPFPTSIVKSWKPACDGGLCETPTETNKNYIEIAKSKELDYKDANNCQKGEDCECSYRKASYSGGETLYYSFEGNDPPSLFYTQNDRDPDTTLLTAKSKIKTDNKLIGMKGYCLEQDTSRSINNNTAKACLTWMPLDTAAGEISVYNYAPEAGLQKDNLQYCLSARGNSRDSSHGLPLSVVTPYYSTVLGEPNVSSTSTDTTGVLAIVPDSGDRWYMTDISRIRFGRLGTSGNDCVNHWTTENPHFIPTQLSDDLNKCDFPPSVDSQPDNCWYKQIIPLPINNDNVSIGNDWKVYHMNNNHQSLGSTGNLEVFRWKSGNMGTASCNKVMFDVVVDNYDNPTEVRGLILYHNDDTGSGNGSAEIQPMIFWREYCMVVGSGSKPWTSRILLQKDLNTALFSPNVTTNEGYFGNILGDSSKMVAVNAGTNPKWFDDQSGATSAPYSYTGGLGANGLKGRMCIGTDNPVSTAAKSYGTSCTVGDECKSGVCTGANPPKSGNIADITMGGWGVGINHLKELFAKVYNISGQAVNWTNQYVPLMVPTMDYSLYNDGQSGNRLPNTLRISGDLPGVPNSPNIKQVVFEANGTSTIEGNTGFTLQTPGGSFNSGDVVLSSPAPVTTLFYAYNPNGEQMPLTDVWVNWDDGSALAGATGKYKNHKHMCEPATVKAKICTTDSDKGKSCIDDTQCSNTPNSCKEGDKPNPLYNFGDSPSACVQDSSSGGYGYFGFTKVYTCSSSSLNYNPNSLGPNQGACEFTPAVMVKDNWDWCLGSTGAKWGLTDCNSSNLSASGWLKFNGTIKVKP